MLVCNEIIFERVSKGIASTAARARRARGVRRSAERSAGSGRPAARRVAAIAPQRGHDLRGLGVGQRGQLLQGGTVSPVAQGLGPLRDHVGTACRGRGWNGQRRQAGHGLALCPCAERGWTLSAALGAQRQRKQLVAKVDAQAAECAVAVGFDRRLFQPHRNRNAGIAHSL